MGFTLLASRNERIVPLGAKGIPHVGELFGVEPDGALRWYRYDGAGQSTPEGTVGWGSNSGNVIGNGWNEFMFLCGGGSGRLFAVDRSGDLHWYAYNGDGTQDPGGALGWSGSQRIGTGWNEFTSLVCTPGGMRSAGAPYVAPVLYGVEPGGDLRWYRYDGNGEEDPSGRTGWAPGSGNTIGNGWEHFQILFSAGGALLGVEPNGDLRWYAYVGQGAEDRSGNTGWSANSGNVIGHGWNRFSKIVGDLSDHDGLGQEIYAIEPNGNMFWYKYMGDGRSDPAGSVGWHPNSGNQIGRGW